VAFKRVTIELDDAPDRGGQTSTPITQEGAREQGFKVRQLTGVPTESDAAETTAANAGQSSPKAPGRTFSDLVAEFMTNSQVMATILMFAPFIVFAGSVTEIAHLLYPAITGVLLNAVWFGIAWFKRNRQSNGNT
jgi:hypothetical protein